MASLSAPTNAGTAVSQEGVLTLGTNTATIAFPNISPGTYILTCILSNAGGPELVTGSNQFTVVGIVSSPTADAAPINAATISSVATVLKTATVQGRVQFQNAGATLAAFIIDSMVAQTGPFSITVDSNGDWIFTHAVGKGHNVLKLLVTDGGQQVNT